METAEYKIMYGQETGHWWYGALHRHILSALEEAYPDWRQRKVLDAGCGTGRLLELLGHPPHHQGVDLSPEALAFCRERGLQNVQKADIAALPFADKTFDAVICASVLYHRWVPDVDQALSELCRVLKPGGVLILNLPAFDFLHSAHDVAVFTERRFTRPQVQALLARQKLETVRLRYWTTFLFPAAWAARFLKLSASGRDFSADGKTLGRGNGLMKAVMQVEFALGQIIPLPFGVALFCVARKAR